MKRILLDTSVIVAVLLRESGWERLEDFILANRCLVSSVAVVEAFLVLHGRSEIAVRESIDRFINGLSVEIISFGQDHISGAQDAFELYGKGKHPAKLNFGDCIVYATAKFVDAPLLFLGNDFILTDIEAVRIP